ncbi:hypothetical protein DFJ58DRAFT_862856 [Suillus subalutaceus]|uniref:uncharacterized protein n=1 Tax=Suillus subalutaceus TaxID=48586 RepID=UPI001B863599|nr:uncharacterized protein DFJ58DRAFT_862856 [Suillus subalutaceus]KAG1837569.1 hypothetical protein DFJ58DRAFT_862856 [Suillus subalutaceus]
MCVAHQKFVTIPLSAQLQALWRDPDQARNMSYLREETRHLTEKLQTNGGVVDVFDDIFKGHDFLLAVQRGDIKPDDVILMISLDGAQLYESKSSDCWIYIWKQFVLPGGFIPGPKKPKNIDSFIFPGMHVWHNIVFISNPYLIFVTADGPGLVYIDGMVGHSGKNGCQLYCGLLGRWKGSHYYPALLIPHHYAIAGSNHPDVSVYELRDPDLTEYFDNLLKLVAAPNTRQYCKLRTETGITKPSLLLSLQPSHTLRIPHCLTPDIMHLAQLLSDLLLSLWRGAIDCTLPDRVSTWPWVVFHDVEIWETHGEAVSDAAQHLPGSFDRKPWNPAEKINSVYIFGLSPVLLYNILPEPYWVNYCKLVCGFQLINQHSISLEDAHAAHVLFTQWELEFETLYYEHHPKRLHFIRPCVHQVNHLVCETIKKGPPICYSQWTMERTIGNLRQEIRQPSNPYANLSREGVRRCQVNALKAMMPELSLDKPPFPTTAIDLGGGYILLRKRDPQPMVPREPGAEAIFQYLGHHHNIKIRRWARLRLPNGQIACTAWRETERPPEKLQPARHVKVVISTIIVVMVGEIRVAEVLYFTQLPVEVNDNDGDQIWTWKDVAVISMFLLPNKDLLDLSCHTVSSCQHEEDDIRVVDLKSILSVVGMVPHQPTLPLSVTEDRFFMVVKPGLDIATFSVLYEGDAAQDDQYNERDANAGEDDGGA